jgi:hypothetical protein
MRIQILDLDGGVCAQPALQARYRPEVTPLQSWGPKIRLACRFGRFRRFERALGGRRGGGGAGPVVTFYGSGDFHHVSLALLRRLTRPCNLLVIDNHPDWMRGVPLLHCGTWVYHAAQLPQVRQVFHAGGDVDFDNSYRWLAPWPMLHEGKITVLPGRRAFERGRWAGIRHKPLRPAPDRAVTPQRLQGLLRPFAAALARHPLYISLDKDVMGAEEAVVNWDSGHLTLMEVCSIVDGFLRAAGGNLAGMDVVGDWSPVRLQGLLRRVFHWTMHPALGVDAGEAARRNEQTNLALLDAVQSATGQVIRAA